MPDKQASSSAVVQRSSSPSGPGALGLRRVHVVQLQPGGLQPLGDHAEDAQVLQPRQIGRERHVGGLAVYDPSTAQDLIDEDLAIRLRTYPTTEGYNGQLQAIVTRPNPYEQTVMDRKQMEQAAQWEDVRRAARAAMARIGC